MKTVYRVIANKTGEILGVYKTRANARRAADKFDLAYGAIICHVTTITL